MEWPRTSRPLPTYAKKVLETLKPKIKSAANGLPRNQAETYLDTEGFEDSTVEVALDELLNCGYVYIVDDQIRLTDDDT